ncbi:hypothetical protein [Flavobacterium sp.]|uniref:hypothetical protein n=1 Tax=Flavobacterium sp. TaxID=239 RepID=UPI0038FC8BC8
MKNFITLLVVVVIFSFQSCTVNETTPVVDNDTISTVFENSVPYNFTVNNGYEINFALPYTLYSSDMVLVYRLTGTVNGNDLWEFLPETHYFSDGTRNFSYNFDFTRNDVQVYLEGNNLGSLNSVYRLNQTFRFVVIPAELRYAVDVNKYSEVMNTLNLKESQVQTINF